MAINFEAANMAGYNNPKIEVFTMLVNPQDESIISAPNKTEIKSSLNRGAIPLMLLTDPNGSVVYVLWVALVNSHVEGDTIELSNGSMTVIYSQNSEQPTFRAG